MLLRFVHSFIHSFIYSGVVTRDRRIQKLLHCRSRWRTSLFFEKRESSSLATWIRVLVSLVSVVDVVAMVDIVPDIGVRFKENSSSFKIAVFADLHYGENTWEAWGPQQDVKSTAVQSFLLDHHLPDFVMYLGDVITANNLPYHDATLHWRQAVGPAVDRHIPFASVFGNHDDAAFVWDPHSGVGPDAPLETTSRAELMEFDKSLPFSFSTAGPETLRPSVSNFVIPISSSGGTEVVAIMYFLDSGGGSMAEFISADQIAWFTTTASKINPDASIPELVFWHIPSIAYTQAGPEPNQPIKAPCVGSINDESIAPQETEWGIMNALANRNSVKDTTMDWIGVVLTTICTSASHGTPVMGVSWKRGARFVEIPLQEPALQIRTFVTLEDGSVVSDMLLNLYSVSRLLEAM